MWKDFDIEELERQYSPSSCVDNLEELVAAYSTDSKASEACARVIKDIPYGDSDDELLDLFPVKGSDVPLIVFIHGGYWQMLSKNEATFAGAGLANKGIAYAAIGYSIAPKATVEEMVDQCVKSINWLYDNAENFGYSREKIFISGSSAGAHLAAMTMIKLSQSSVDQAKKIIKGAILMSGVYDLRPLINTYVNEPLKLDEKRLHDLSPALLKLEALPYAIICWGENETDEFKRQSIDFAKVYKDASGVCDDFEIPGYNHFNIVEKLETASIEPDNLMINIDRQ